MIINLKTLSQEEFSVELPEDASVYDLKQSISEIKVHPADNIRIIFNGKVLDTNEMKLKEFEVKHGSTLVILLQKNKPKPQVKEEKKEETTSWATIQPTVQPPIQTPIQPPTQPINTHQMFSNILQNHPQEFMQLLLSNPEMQTIYNQDPNAFMNLLSGPNFINSVVQVGEQLENLNLNNQVLEADIDLNDNEKQEVNDLVNMGFRYDDVIQYYMALEKNKELTAHALMNEMLDEQSIPEDQN